jgi:isocitrate dehydrogenase (NAD+)
MSKHRKVVTVLTGDGIGPEICTAAIGVLQAAQAPVEFETFTLPPIIRVHDPLIPIEVLASISRNAVVLKGPFFTPVGQGYASRNLELRRTFDLGIQVVPVQSFPGVVTRHKDVNFVLIRENTEGEYAGFEQEIVPGVVQSLKITTEHKSLAVAEYAFNYARNAKRKKVTAVHKANIQKLTDGLFLECCRKVAQQYSGEIAYEEMIVDNTAMQLVQNPSQFDVVLTPNLYGNIVGNTGAGLVGGPGMLAGANFGPRVAMFEPGARHVAKDIAGENKANPTAMILAAAMMLRHLGFTTHAERVEKAVFKTYSTQYLRTYDLGGTASTTEFTKAIIHNL